MVRAQLARGIAGEAMRSNDDDYDGDDERARPELFIPPLVARAREARG